METTIDEITPDIYRLSTCIPEVMPPEGFTFNQFLLDGDEPMLFHTGMRQLFPLVSEAVERVVPLERLRWIGFGHVEADECGAMNALLAAAPHAQVVHGQLACELSLFDMCDRPPRPLTAGEVLDIGRHRLRFLPTPHVPHNWESGLFFDEATGTLLGGDLFTAGGNGAALREDDPVGPAMAAETLFGGTSLGPAVPRTVRDLADLAPTTIATMHGSSYAGDGRAALLALADAYQELVDAAVGP
jgi:flavorubredoxin